MNSADPTFNAGHLHFKISGYTAAQLDPKVDVPYSSDFTYYDINI